MKMSDPKVIKKSEIERRHEEESRVELRYMLLLMRRYPEKAREYVQKLVAKTPSIG